MNNESLKKLGLIVAASLIIFWVFKPKGNDDTGNSFFGGSKSNGKIIKPILPEDQMQDESLRTAYEALCAYIDASNEGQSKAVLDGIKQDFQQQMGLVIYTDATGKLAVKDVQGNDILVN